ncbi:multidrug effflux MFS transporter [uncultured Roseibium sp.]|uniref:multidrug effflux MFS transporter n=1 Tax=uncultured Roseibium sp. TaxID=1936171 RepID=UPI003217E239
MTAAAEPAMSARRTTILGAALVAIGPITMSLYTPAMPELAVDFGTSDALIKLTLTTYFAGFALTQLICGPLSDAFGRKPVTIVFLVLYLASTVLATLAPDITWMLIARALQGVGAAVGVAVSRAIVRDQYTGQHSARIMNTIGTMLALGPAISPTIGGIILEVFGWREIFICMLIYGAALMAAVIFFQPETNAYRNVSNIHPERLAINYMTLLSDRKFMAPSVLLGMCLGNVYAMATVLPFVMIHDVGLTPAQFGLGMMMQSLSFISGTLVTGRLLKYFDAEKLIPIGIIGMIAASALIAILLRLYEPTYLIVMGPVGFFAFSVAFILPATLTSAMRDFPHIAGASSSMMGFMQFGGGILGSLLIAAMGNPLFGMSTIIPAMPLVGVILYFLLRMNTGDARAAAE